MGLILIQTNPPPPEVLKFSGNFLIGVGVIIVVALVVWGWVRHSQARSEGPPTASQPRSLLDYGAFFIVALGIIIVGIATIFALIFYYSRISQVATILTALFGIIGTLVGTYFGVKSSLDAREGAENLAGRETPAPTVSVVSPRDGEKVANRRPLVSATFSKAMAPAKITTDTFKLVSIGGATPTPVPGTVTCDAHSMVATFTPTVDLALGPYQATITTGAKDLEGNALDSVHSWKFTVVP